jgi:hypothetical protein
VLAIVRNLSSREGPVVGSVIFGSSTRADVEITAEMAQRQAVCPLRCLLRCEIEAFKPIEKSRLFFYPIESRE